MTSDPTCTVIIFYFVFQKYKFDFCVFCKNNGEDERFYLSHTLKDDSGAVSCPILRAYVCPICGASGAVAHTIKYCPQGKNENHEALTTELSITQLKKMRSSTGKQRQSLSPPPPPSPLAMRTLPPVGTPPQVRGLSRLQYKSTKCIFSLSLQGSCFGNCFDGRCCAFSPPPFSAPAAFSNGGGGAFFGEDLLFEPSLRGSDLHFPSSPPPVRRRDSSKAVAADFFGGGGADE